MFSNAACVLLRWELYSAVHQRARMMLVLHAEQKKASINYLQGF